MNRDKLNTEKNYQEIIDLNIGFIQKRIDKISQLQKDELNGIRAHTKPNNEVIKSTEESIFKYSLDNLLTYYSIGATKDSVIEQYLNTLSYFIKTWRKSNGYVQMIWMLSIGIMLEIKSDEFKTLVDLVQTDNPNDFLIDFLIHAKTNWPQQSETFMFAVPYKATKEVIEIAKTNKTMALARLKRYLQKEWYKGHSDSGWHDSHKSKWNIHTGYWSFESGALVKILGLDDSSLKEQQYYPYDMVHWK